MSLLTVSWVPTQLIVSDVVLFYQTFSKSLNCKKCKITYIQCIFIISFKDEKFPELLR